MNRLNVVAALFGVAFGFLVRGGGPEPVRRHP
ncbi:hypothetical protein BH23CHL1_BH23CHL1_17140 [soil metagenome]